LSESKSSCSSFSIETGQEVNVQVAISLYS